MANLDLATLLVKIEGDISDINGKFDDVAKQSNKAKEKVVAQWQDAADKVGKLGQKMTTFITLPLVAAGTAAVKMASDLTETFSKTNEVFKESANTVLEWSNNSIENMGMAQQTALDMASTFTDLILQRSATWALQWASLQKRPLICLCSLFNSRQIWLHSKTSPSNAQIRL